MVTILLCKKLQEKQQQLLLLLHSNLLELHKCVSVGAAYIILSI